MLSGLCGVYLSVFYIRRFGVVNEGDGSLTAQEYPLTFLGVFTIADEGDGFESQFGAVSLGKTDVQALLRGEGVVFPSGRYGSDGHGIVGSGEHEVG